MKTARIEALIFLGLAALLWAPLASAPHYEVSAAYEALSLFDVLRGEKYSPFASELQLVDHTTVTVYRFNPVSVQDSLALSTSLLHLVYRYTAVLVSDSLSLASSILSHVYSYLGRVVEEVLSLEISFWSWGLPGIDEAMSLIIHFWSYMGPRFSEVVSLGDSLEFNLYKLYDLVLSLSPLDGIFTVFRENLSLFMDDGPPLFGETSSSDHERLTISDGLSVSVTYGRELRDSGVILDALEGPLRGVSEPPGDLVVGAGLVTGFIIVAVYALRHQLERFLAKI